MERVVHGLISLPTGTLRAAGRDAATVDGALDTLRDHLLSSWGTSPGEATPAQLALGDRLAVGLLQLHILGVRRTSAIVYDAQDVLTRTLPRYASVLGDVHEFNVMVHRLHEAGIEVILDVVYNHTAEGNHLGPTLSFKGIDNRSYYHLADDPRFYFDTTGIGNTVNLGHPRVMQMVTDSLRYWVETCHVDGFRFDLATSLARERRAFDPDSSFLDAVRQDPVLSKVKMIAEPAGCGTCCSQGPTRSKVLTCSGQGRFALWLPGTAAKPPSPGPTSPRAKETTTSPLNMRPLRQW